MPLSYPLMSQVDSIGIAQRGNRFHLTQNEGALPDASRYVVDIDDRY